MNIIEKIGVFLYRVSDKLNIKNIAQAKAFVLFPIFLIGFPLVLYTGNKK